jgi:hypothetical protein
MMRSCGECKATACGAREMGSAEGHGVSVPETNSAIIIIIINISHYRHRALSSEHRRAARPVSFCLTETFLLSKPRLSS